MTGHPDSFPSDPYTGQVAPGGSPDTRDLGSLIITKLAVDEQMSNNAYLLRCAETGDQLLIDAAADAPRLLELIGDRPLATVLTTHQHWDHHRALAEVADATGAEVAAGIDDADAITAQTGVPVGHALSDGERIHVGLCELEVIHLNGHTPGSVALLYRDTGSRGEHSGHLFTGDSLFPGGPGKTANPTDFASLMDDLEEKVFGTLPDDVWFYPGHGDDSTLGAERASIPEWRARGW